MNSNAAFISASLAALAYLSCASAVQATDQGFYVGGYYGALERDVSKADDAVLLGSISNAVYQFGGFDPVSTDARLSVDDKSWGFFAGYRWTPNLALELGYLQLGEVTYRSNDQVLDVLVAPPVLYPAESRTRSELSALTFSVLGIWPLTYQWELFGRAGISLTETEWRTHADIEGFSPGRFGDSKSNADLLAGVGISYTFLDVYTVRAEAQRVFDAGNEDFVRESDIDLVSLGISVSF
ncbi:MAG: outer membrane beta-barrel protein [Steroidobacteraceae bacterium]